MSRIDGTSMWRSHNKSASLGSSSSVSPLHSSKVLKEHNTINIDINKTK